MAWGFEPTLCWSEMPEFEFGALNHSAMPFPQCASQYMRTSCPQFWESIGSKNEQKGIDSLKGGSCRRALFCVVQGSLQWKQLNTGLTFRGKSTWLLRWLLKNWGLHRTNFKCYTLQDYVFVVEIIRPTFWSYAVNSTLFNSIQFHFIIPNGKFISAFTSNLPKFQSIRFYHIDSTKNSTSHNTSLYKNIKAGST